MSSTLLIKALFFCKLPLLDYDVARVYLTFSTSRSTMAGVTGMFSGHNAQDPTSHVSFDLTFCQVGLSSKT